MKTIPLTKGQVALVDDEDFEYLSQFKWMAVWQPTAKTFYAVRHISGKGQLSGVYSGRSKDSRKSISMHRELAGAAPVEEIDHRNHRGLDNQKENLRRASRSQNQSNRRLWKKSTSGFKGVTWHRLGWQSRLQINKTRIHLGYFPTSEEAARAYDVAAKQHHGEFARLNFPSLTKQ